MAEKRELGSATVYFNDEEYEKTEDDFNPDDYETREEYRREREKETPGIRYENVILLPDGWVECVQMASEDADNVSYYATTVPQRRIERISWKKADKMDGEWVYDATGEMEEGDG